MMIDIKCRGCTNSCCGVNPKLTPVLLPSEEKRFKEYSKKVETPSRDMWTLAKNEQGTCIFLDDKTMMCKAYDKRPLECKLYPFLLDFSNGVADAKLDMRFCPHLKTLTFDKRKITALVQSNDFPKDWIKGYQSMDEY